MLTVFSKRTLSIILSLCMLLSCAAIASASDETITLTDYQNLVEGAEKKIDVGTATIVTNHSATSAGIRVGDTGGNMAGNIVGFTDLKNGNSIQGTTKVANATEPGNETNTVLKMTGQTAETDGAEVYSAFDIRRADTTVSYFHPTDAKNNYLQLWEIKVKIPTTASGELRLFVYSNDSWYSGPQHSRTSQIKIVNNNVYRAGDSYNATSEPQYDDCIATGLTAGEWYTFVRVMDLRNLELHKDKVYIFDKDGKKVNESSAWKTAGKFVNYSTNTRMSLGFAGKNFNTGEDVYFDDLRVWYFDEPTMEATLDGSTSTVGKMMALEYSAEQVKSDSHTWVTDKYQNYLRAGQNQDYSIDLFLPDVGEDSSLKLFSVMLYHSWTKRTYNHHAFAIKGGAVYTCYNKNESNKGYAYDNATKVIETAMTKADGSALVLSPKTWYTFSYKFDITTGAFTASVKERGADSALATSTGTIYNTTTVEKSKAGRLSIIGVKGFSSAVLFDNAVCVGKDTSGNVVAGTDSVNFDFNDLSVGSAFSTLTTHATYPQNVGVPCYAVSEGDFFLTGEEVTSPEDVLPMKISGIKGSGFTADNVKVYVNDEEIKNGCTISTEGGSYTVVFNDLEYGVTYTLKLVNQISDDKWELPIAGEFTFTIAEDKLVIEQPTINGSLGENSITATVNITNGRKTPVNYVVVLALYNGDTLDKIAIKDGTLTSQPDVEVPITTDPIDATNATSAQIMIWDGWSSLRPLHAGLALPTAE